MHRVRIQAPLTNEQLAVKGFLDTLDKSGVFESPDASSHQMDFGVMRRMPYLGRMGTRDIVEVFKEYPGACNPWLDDDVSYGSIAIMRDRREKRVNRGEVVTDVTLQERIDGSGIDWVTIDPSRLALSGCRERFMIFSKNQVVPYTFDETLAIANRILDGVVAGIPQTTV
jgi:hypothetical protein